MSASSAAGAIRTNSDDIQAPQAAEARRSAVIMIITTEGIVLRQRKIANNRRMIVLFTKRCGKLSAGTSINEKSRSRAALRTAMHSRAATQAKSRRN